MGSQCYCSKTELSFRVKTVIFATTIIISVAALIQESSCAVCQENSQSIEGSRVANTNMKANELVTVFKAAQNRKDRAAAAASIVRFDEIDPTELLIHSDDASVALTCLWHRLVGDHTEDLTIEARSTEMLALSKKFGSAIEAELNITPPQEWLNVISNAYGCREHSCRFNATLSQVRCVMELQFWSDSLNRTVS